MTGLRKINAPPRKDRSLTGEGRKEKYKPEFCQLARRLAMLGLVDKQIAAALGIAANNYRLWQHKHPEFRAAIVNGKAKADAAVAASLFKRATGFTDPTGKYWPPDSGAAMSWLTNRARGRWSRPNKGGTSTSFESTFESIEEKPAVSSEEAQALYRRFTKTMH